MHQTRHPTSAKLVGTTVELLESKRPDEIAVDDILALSGISKGSLYHHFEDLNELLEVAQIVRYSNWVDRSIELLARVISSSITREEFLSGLSQVTNLTQSSEYSQVRAERVRTIANAQANPRFKIALGAEQERLTLAISDVIRDAVARGIYRSDLNIRVAAVFIQSYTLGKIVDDITTEHMDSEDWNSLIYEITDRVFFTK